MAALLCFDGGQTAEGVPVEVKCAFIRHDTQNYLEILKFEITPSKATLCATIREGGVCQWIPAWAGGPDAECLLLSYDGRRAVGRLVLKTNQIVFRPLVGEYTPGTALTFEAARAEW